MIEVRKQQSEKRTIKEKLQLVRYKKYHVMILAAVVVIIVIAGLYDWNQVNTFEMNNTSSLHYVKAKVVSVDSEDIEKDPYDESNYIGTQELTVELLQGELKGTQQYVLNSLTRTQNVKVTEGQRVIVCADTPENAEPYFTIYNYYRFPALLIMIGVFVLTIILIGGKKGVRSVLGLAFSVYFILIYMVQAIFHGQAPVIAAIITIAIVSLASMYFLNGLSRKTYAAAVSTGCGVLCAAGIFLLFAKFMHVSGYNLDQSDALILVAQSTGLQVHYLLFAGVLVSALGAVMDVAVSIGSALYELITVDETLSQAQLFRSGLNIGKDMIGTMSNTLILAYTGTALSTMILLIAYGYQTQQLLSSNYLAMEVLQGIASTMGVVLTVPAASLVSAFIYKPKHKRKTLGGHS